MSRSSLSSVFVAAVVLLTAVACSRTDERPNTVAISERPSMEKVIDDYEQMRAEMVEELTAELGAQSWGETPNSPGQGRSRCGADGADGERVSLSTQGFRGTYDRSDWRRATEIVRRVGKKYGFAETGTIVDRADDLEVYGEDEYGAHYIFGMATNTFLSVSTGCHRWDQPPPAAPAPSGPPSYAE